MKITKGRLFTVGLYFIGSLFAVAHTAVAKEFIPVNIFLWVGLSAWTLANTQNVIQVFKDWTNQKNLTEIPSEEPMEPSTHRLVNYALNMSASSSFFIKDVIKVREVPLYSLRLVGASLWFANSSLSMWKEKKRPIHPEDFVKFDRINEMINQSGSLFYLSFTLILWTQGEFMPLRLSANLCWVIAALHDLIKSFEQKNYEPVIQEVNPVVLQLDTPKTKTELTIKI